MQQQYPQYAGNPMVTRTCLSRRWASSWCSSRFCWHEADKLGIHVTDDDVRQYLQTGPAGRRSCFPNGKFIGAGPLCRHHRRAGLTSRWRSLKSSVKQDIAIRRLGGADHGRGDGERPGSARRLSQEQHQDQVRLRGDLLGRPAQADQPLGRGPGSVLQEERGALCNRGA